MFILTNLSKLQADVLALNLIGYSKEWVERKYEALNAQIPWIALMSAAGGAIPLIGVSPIADIGLIITFSKKCQISFGLEEHSASFWFDNMFFRAFISQIKEAAEMVTVGFITELIAKYAAANVAEETIKYVIPGIGSVISASISATTTYFICKDVLEKFKQKALDVVNIVVQEQKRISLEEISKTV